MKIVLAIAVFLWFGAISHAQNFSNLQQALTSPTNSVQGIHHYPKNIKDGECHNVPVTSIVVNGTSIVITETWTNYTGGKSKTVLRGTLQGTTASGTWESSYSSGNWNYDFSAGIGRWNKTRAPLRFGVFDAYQPLEFRIVTKEQLKDAFRPCK